MLWRAKRLSLSVCDTGVYELEIGNVFYNPTFSEARP